ncbi:hypothetical protein FHS51_001379 [Sphingobium wenxiniae]|uniref:Uncharacterized protein n=1 Tax=Sphingobium wenxiniae (strain DSM 21828 / CGMCC 1.7748 / JZ-1) TaxID=595605 RepID=A0A562KLD4_SPHWJ|nr:hypothetical protein [Sphingobium wenxiniae]MBB6191157.1 hypothetical protein [Sphingobium wenxiniae]TWH96043.1 hypothetical protein IQ35_01132 [Sphingobium wenxiniae]
MTLLDLLATIIMARLPRSPEDWAPGDLAVCIDTSRFLSDEINPKEGDYLRVSRPCSGGLFLHFEGKPDTRHWLAVCFHKVKPDAKPADDEEWVEQLKHMRRRVDA